MSKYIIISKQVYGEYKDKDEFLKLIKDMCKDENKFIFISRDSESVEKMKKYFESKNLNKDTNLFVKKRNDIEEIIKNLKDTSDIVIIGNRDRDFFTATNNKILYIVPTWCKEIYPSCIKYGINIENLSQFREILKTKNNQKNWYYKEVLNDGTEVYSLMSGMSMLRSISMEEKELVEGFRAFLKEGKTDYYKILYYHFISAITNLQEFKQIDTWGIAPSSGTSFNKEMMLFKDKARVMMHSRVAKESENIFLRSVKIKKSHEMNASERERFGATRHLQTIYLNPYYKSKIKGKNICIFDDYLTHGNTFEAMRNILRKAGANKIIFVSLGRFKKPYIYQEYKIDGDVYKANGFMFNEISREYIEYRCNDVARLEVEKLHKIFNL